MPTAPDDLKPGMYVAVVDRKDIDHDRMPRGMFITKDFNGTPLEVIAVSLPFVLVERNGSRFALDVRKIDVMKLNARYVREFDAFEVAGFEDEMEEVHDLSLCPTCGDRLVHRRTVGTPGWFDVCRHCGYEREAQ